jgi:hypothetical protein
MFSDDELRLGEVIGKMQRAEEDIDAQRETVSRL